jgi:hypothetical protein
MLATRVEAMTPSPLGAAAANTDLVQQAAVVCGPRGCVHRPTRPFRRPLWNSWGGGWNTWNGCDPVGRYRVEDARPTDLDGEAGGELA